MLFINRPNYSFICLLGYVIKKRLKTALFNDCGRSLCCASIFAQGVFTA